MICRIFVFCNANLLINWCKIHVHVCVKWHALIMICLNLVVQARCWLSRILLSTWPRPRPCRRTWTCITSVRPLPASCSCPCTGHAPSRRSTFLGQFSYLRVRCGIKDLNLRGWKGRGRSVLIRIAWPSGELPPKHLPYINNNVS